MVSTARSNQFLLLLFYRKKKTVKALIRRCSQGLHCLSDVLFGCTESNGLKRFWGVQTKMGLTQMSQPWCLREMHIRLVIRGLRIQLVHLEVAGSVPAGFGNIVS